MKRLKNAQSIGLACKGKAPCRTAQGAPAEGRQREGSVNLYAMLTFYALFKLHLTMLL